MHNIYIFTEGGGETGMGHISRCLSLYQAFEMRGYFPQFIINGNESVVSAVSGTRYQLFDWIADVDKTITLLQDASIVLIDSYKCPVFLYQLIKNESLFFYSRESISAAKNMKNKSGANFRT